MTKYEDVKTQTTEEYFENNKFSIDAFRKKYAINDNETYVEALWRVCTEISSVEKNKKIQEYWRDRWFDEIYNDWWHPAGSIMQGAGSGKSVSLANCTTNSLGKLKDDEEWDNLESIIKNTAYTVAKCAAFRQGLGVDFSRLRPKGLKVENSANESTGSVHWMGFIDNVANYVGQKGRIPAMLFSLNCKHPDIEEFITVKSDFTKIQNANISVQCSDNFYEAVLDDKEWILEFDIPEIKKGQKVYVDEHSINRDCEKDEIGWFYISKKNRESEHIEKKISAKYLLELIAQNMCNFAEPGIQNTDVAKRLSNSDYLYDPNSSFDSRIVSTNACSEQYLNRDGLCILSSLNCEMFDTKNYKEELMKFGESINRFLDNVISYELEKNTFATSHQKESLEQLRRTGAGYTNISAWLFKLQYEYGSKEANDAVEDFTKWYNYALYKSSIQLGEEKGSFKAFDRKKIEQSPFIQRMMGMGLEFIALRNVTNSSIAPTGTLSLMFRRSVMSYGIEPAFDMYFWKRTRISGSYTYYFCVPRIVREFYKERGYEIPMDSDTIEDTWGGKYGKPIVEFIEKHKADVNAKFIPATEVSAHDKLNLMAQVMKWIDSSISVTYMLPEDADWKMVYDFILDGWKRGVKSIAAFPDKKLYGIVSFIPFKDLAFKLKEEGIELHYKYNFTESELAELGASSENINIKTGKAPKRPKTIDAEIYPITAKGEKYIIAVGLLNGQPYEIFGGKANGFGIKSSCNGKLIKHKKGQYGLEMDKIEIDDFSKHFTPEEQTIFRLASTNLRHGIPIEFVVEQMQKSTDDMFSLPSAVSRVLKKYITDGQKVNGKKCPSCGTTDLFYTDGCMSCQCGWSQCS